MRINIQIFLSFFLLLITIPSVVAQERDAEGSKDHPLIERMPDFFIGRSTETASDKETFKTDQGRIEIQGKRYYLDYRLRKGKNPPGKFGILNYYQAKFKNSYTETLLDGPYYDVYKIKNNGGETWVKIDPGVYDGKRYEVTVVESNTIIETAIESVGLMELKVIKESGQVLLKKNKTIAKSPNQFIYDKPQKVKLRASVTNPGSIARGDLRVEFLLDRKVIDTSELVSLEPGAEKEIECEYELPDMGTYNIEVNVYEEATPHPLASIDGQLLGEDEEADVSGLVYPDLQIRDIVRLINPERIAVEIQNNGAPLNENVLLKTWFSDPYSSYSDHYEISIDMDLKPGERKWFDLIKPFSWPNPIDNPQLTFTIAIDTDKKIAEVDENNNSYYKVICVPCKVQIDELSNPWVYKPNGYSILSTIDLYGKFGYNRASKRVVFVNEANGVKYYPHIFKDLRDPVIWSNNRLEVGIGNLPGGTYKIFVYCSSAGNPPNIPYSSNSMDFRVRKRPKDESFSFEDFTRIALVFPLLTAQNDQQLDAQSLANALADEFSDGLEFVEPIPEELWVAQSSSGLGLNVNLNDDKKIGYFEKIIFEIWKPEPRIRLRFIEVPLTQNPQNCQIQNLEMGIYEFKARYIYVGGQEITKSIVFRVQ